MKTFTFSSVPTKTSVEQLAQYERRELENVVRHFQQLVDELEQELIVVKQRLDELETN